MDLSKADGVLKGLNKRLSPIERDFLLKEFRNYSAQACSWTVSRAGEFIWESLTQEDALKGKDLEHFQDYFIRLLRTSSKLSPSCGCAFHRDQLVVLGTKLRKKGSSWLVTFFDVLTSVDEKLHLYLPGRKVNKKDSALLSHFMLLNKFVTHNTSARGQLASKKLEIEMIKKLSPLAAPHTRYDLLMGKNRLMLLKGTIGSYCNPVGATERLTPCKGVKPFSTFTDEVSKLSPNRSFVEKVLCNLGIPFDRKEVWIELQYPITAAAVDFKKHGMAMACPTVIEARGKWAFRPDRPKSCVHGIARNLKNNLKGIPEVAHEPVPIQALRDAIVWPTVTTGWGIGSNLRR